MAHSSTRRIRVVPRRSASTFHRRFGIGLFSHPQDVGITRFHRQRCGRLIPPSCQVPLGNPCIQGRQMTWRFCWLKSLGDHIVCLGGLLSVPRHDRGAEHFQWRSVSFGKIEDVCRQYARLTASQQPFNLTSSWKLRKGYMH